MKNCFYTDSHIGTQVIDPINLQEETSDRVNIFGQVKMEVIDKDGDGRISLKCTTSYYTSSGVLLASFDWKLDHPGHSILQLGLFPHDEQPYMPGDIPNIITPGIRIHHLSVTTEPIDIESVFPEETCPSFWTATVLLQYGTSQRSGLTNTSRTNSPPETTSP